jgi:hypothetical protein
MRSPQDADYCKAASRPPGPPLQPTWDGCDSTCQYEEAQLEAQLARETASFGTPLVLNFDEEQIFMGADGWTTRSPRRDQQIAFLGHGVPFDLFDDGTRPLLDWLAPNAGYGFLALPDCRNNVTNGSQLFGKEKPDGTAHAAVNGFASLARYDDNGNGAIDPHDKIFPSLAVWFDLDSNGISSPNEVTALTALTLNGDFSIGLRYGVIPPQNPGTSFIGFLGSFEYTVTARDSNQGWSAKGQVADVYFPVSTPPTVSP